MLRKIVSALSALCLAVGLLPLPALAASERPAEATGSGASGLSAAAVGNAGSYYVATNGDDGNPGTIEEPFKTIAHAASVMQAGDTCYIRGGTYRERLADHVRKDSNGTEDSPTIPKLKGTKEEPFTFQAHGDEKVTLTGCDPVTGWEKVDGLAANIWRAPMSWDMYLGKTLGSGMPLPEGQEDGIANGNLVFAQGRPCLEGRWTNAYATAPATAACGIPDSIMDLDRYARTDAGTGNANSALRIVDADLAAAEVAGALPADADLSGAQVWCAGGDGYDSLIWLINSHDKATGTISLDTLKDAPSYFIPKAASSTTCTARR